MGTGHVDKLEGAEAEKERLRLILKTVSGELTVREACEMLGLSESRFHELRDQALQGALDGIAPRPAGRQAEALDPKDEEIRKLKADLLETKKELVAEQVRSEIALAMPHLVHKPEDEAARQAVEREKKRETRRARKRQRHERSRQRRLAKKR
jgi:hypothetical protein